MHMCLCPALSSLAKAFEVHDGSNILPVAAAYEACISGKHSPVNPHRQRLLVASHKEAKLQKTNKKGPAAKGKAGKKHNAEADKEEQTAAEPKAETPAPKPTQTPKPAEEATAACAKTKGKPNKASKQKGTKRPDTFYNTARKAFQAKFLGGISLSFLSYESGAYKRVE